VQASPVDSEVKPNLSVDANLDEAPDTVIKEEIKAEPVQSPVKRARRMASRKKKVLKLKLISVQQLYNRKPLSFVLLLILCLLIYEWCIIVCSQHRNI